MKTSKFKTTPGLIAWLLHILIVFVREPDDCRAEQSENALGMESPFFCACGETHEKFTARNINRMNKKANI